MHVKLGEGHIIEVLMTLPKWKQSSVVINGDAFSVLGPHPVRVAKGGGKSNGKPTWEIRAFLPQARNAVLLVEDTEIPMEKRHKEASSSPN